MAAFPDQVHTSRLLLRRIRPSDAEFVHTYASDPQATRYVAWPCHKAITETISYLSAAEAEWDKGVSYEYLVLLRAEGIPIGAVSAIPSEHAITIGYILASTFWGKGFAPEAAAAIVNIAINLPRIYRVWTVCDTDHSASARVLEKIGMQREGILRKWKVRPNIDPSRPRDSFCYALTKET